MVEKKLSFDYLSDEEDKIFSNISSMKEAEEANRKFQRLLNSGGWTKQEYETELLKKIDKKWETILPSLNKNKLNN